MTAPPIETVHVTVEEFWSWVGVLAEAAGLVAEKAPHVAEQMTMEDAAQVVARLDEVRDVVRAAADPISVRIAQVWDAGHDAVVEVADLEISVKHRHDRREWDHHAIAREVVRRRLAGLAAADLPAPTPYDVVDWLLDAELPSYWRKEILADLGIDLRKFSKGRDERPRGHARRKTTEAVA